MKILLPENGTYPKKFREIDLFDFMRFFLVETFLNYLGHSEYYKIFSCLKQGARRDLLRRTRKDLACNIEGKTIGLGMPFP